MNTLQMQVTAHVLAAHVVANGDAAATIRLIEIESKLQADRPGLSYTLQAIARLARRYVEKGGHAPTATHGGG